MKTPAAVAVFLVYAVCSGTALIMLKLGMAQFKPEVSLILRNYKLLIGFTGYIFGFFLWLYILSKFRINVAFPVANALFYVVSCFGSYFILKETFSLNIIIGIVLCLSGIILISLK